ncbi:hypothetical protein [Fictibacillus terranigra]|uniref:GIY-YIG domain-containing protein n=1 Tax=Fictibacillus terranigra TaxID=3058424 RepID=A0ABT8EBI7_9BACL|nr:hypothetical protein [Fictibacillus sp. CENA-BCM004]MDN4075293.1 hypothetical protein [Fictibacillus sp. CENA-BCM004]
MYEGTPFILKVKQQKIIYIGSALTCRNRLTNNSLPSFYKNTSKVMAELSFWPLASEIIVNGKPK